MKVCILGDTHWGVRNDLPIFYTHFEEFYRWMFDTLKVFGVKEIYQLGDLFDRRKFINFRTLSESKRILFDKLVENSVCMFTLIGNHDIYYRDVLDINSSSLLLDGYLDYIRVVDEPTTLTLEDNTTIDLIPWICPSKEKEILEYIKNSKSDLCFGHFEISKLPMYVGVESHTGLDIRVFEHYELVCSGHYHTKSSKDNVVYVGTPYEMTWQDYNDPKGIHIFDTETRELTFIESPLRKFVKIEYNDTQEIPDVSTLNLKDCFVKVIITCRTDLYKFDIFFTKLQKSGAYEVKIIESMSGGGIQLQESNDENDGGKNLDLGDTMSILSEYVDTYEVEYADDVKLLLKSLYVEAINSGVVND